MRMANENRERARDLFGTKTFYVRNAFVAKKEEKNG
jgi:hypothetical protein